MLSEISQMEKVKYILQGITYIWNKKKKSNSNSKKKKKREWKVGYQTLEGWGKLGKVAKRVKTFSYWKNQV